MRSYTPEYSKIETKYVVVARSRKEGSQTEDVHVMTLPRYKYCIRVAVATLRLCAAKCYMQNESVIFLLSDSLARSHAEVEQKFRNVLARKPIGGAPHT